MAQIRLSNGGVASVDDSDYKMLSGHSWYVVIYGQKQYAQCRIGTKHVFMHKLLTGWEQTDHKNGDGLDNRRQNLRECNHSTNAMNKEKLSGCTSRYKGVSFHKGTQKWRAYIKKEGKVHSLGYFFTQEQAALAYNNKAQELFGEFANLNKVGE